MILFLLPFALGALAGLGLGFGRDVPAPKSKPSQCKNGTWPDSVLDALLARLDYAEAPK